jgi:hypothetical protein
MMSLRTSHRGDHKLPAVLAAILMLTGPGCASVQLLNFKGDKIPKTDAQHPPIEILAIWQAAEGPGLGGVPTRGFAGQIFFFTQDRAQPVAVDGVARIYVFDDRGTAEQQARPLRQFDFDRQSWTAHLQNGKLGPAYGVFIPYPRNDFHQAVCSLRIRFTPSTSKGQPLFSASSTITLPGPPAKPEVETAQASPLDKLARKLQAQPQVARPWNIPSLDTEPRPLNSDPQMAATQPQGGVALTSHSANAYSMGQQPQAARVSPVIQTSGTTDATTAGAPQDPMVSAENPVGYSPGRSPEAAQQPSGRFKLQAAVTNANYSSESGGSVNFEDQRPADVQVAPLPHPNHPLAD